MRRLVACARTGYGELTLLPVNRGARAAVNPIPLNRRQALGFPLQALFDDGAPDPEEAIDDIDRRTVHIDKISRRRPRRIRQEHRDCEGAIRIVAVANTCFDAINTSEN